MALVRNGRLVEDPYVRVAEGESVPATGPVLFGLAHWLAARESLIARQDLLGIRLASDQHPEAIAPDLARFALVALEFPVFRDGRAYTYARLLRERWRYDGELRATGDVMLEQLHFMHRVGFDSFEIRGRDPLGDWAIANGDCSAWYQAAPDGRQPAWVLRHLRPALRRSA